jgi:integrase
LILAFYTGVRIGELCTLKRSDNIEKYFLTIQRTEVTYKDKALNKYVTTIKESTKGDETRVIDLPKKAQAIIDQLYLLNPNGEFLFMDDKGRIKSKRFNYYLTKACRELGIQEKTSHKMRKTYGSNLLEKEVGEAIVQGQLGHKQISTTHNFYHYDITDDDERSDIINQAVVY